MTHPGFMRVLAAAALFALALPVFAQEDKPKPEAEARALCDQAKGKHGKAALDLYNQAIALDMNCIDAYIGRGAERRYDEPQLALADFARADAIKDDFQPAASWYRIVTLLDVYLDRVAAWDEAERLKRRSQKGGWPYLAAGMQKLLLGRYPEAEEDFDTAGRNDAGIPLAWRFKALAEFEYGNALAKDAALQAAKDLPDDPGTQATVALIQGADDAAVAARELDRILSEHPKLAWAHVAKAKACVKNSKWEDALTALKGADAAAPAGPEVAYLRGLALGKLLKFTEAETSLTRAVVWDSNFPDALLERGNVRGSLRDWSGALRDYETWQRFALDPQSQKMLSDKIAAAKTKKERDEGVIVSYGGHCNRARVYIDEEDYDRAAKDLETAKGMDEKNERWRRLWMFYYAKKKDLPKMWEACQGMIDAGAEGIVPFFDKSGDGGALFDGLRKKPEFLEGLRKITTKNARDGYYRAQTFYEVAMPDLYKSNRAMADGLLKEAAAEFRKMSETFKDSREVPGAYYNEACCWALVNDADRAFETLEKSIEAGYGKNPGEINHMEKTDTDFDNVHKDPRWEAIVKKIKDKWEKK